MSRWAAVPLLLLVPLVWNTGFSAARLATRDPRLARWLAPALGLAAWLFSIHAIGLASHSFYVGLFAGTIVVAALGFWGGLVLTAPSPEMESRSPWIWIGMLLALVVIAGPELRWSEHDECLVTGHVSLPLQMQNGIYPPRYSTFPQFEVRYHYGIDLADAVASTLLGRLDMQPTVHLVAVALWGYTFLLLWLLGERLISGAFAGPVTAFGVLLAGGASFFCRSLAPLGGYLMSDCAPGGTWITPPLISNFLQHPWSLGIPLFLAILLLLPLRAAQFRNLWWWGVLSLLFAVLSFAQVVLFLCALPTVIGAVWLEGKRSPQRLLRLALWGVAIVLVARMLHGFFAPGLEPKAGTIEFHPYWRDTTFVDWLAWNWDAMGFLLPFGIAGFFAWPPRGASRLVLAVLAAGGLLVRNLFVYSHSWDIVKFSMVSQIALALLTAALLARALQHRRTLALGVAGLLLCSAFGVGWSAALTFDEPGLIFCRDLTPRPKGAEAEAVAFLRGHIRAGEGIFRTQDSDAYALYGGLPTPGWDWGVESFGFSRELFTKRQQLIDHPSSDPQAYLRQSFRWLVLSDRDQVLRTSAAQWTSEGRAELAAEFQPLQIYRLTGELVGPSAAQ